MSKKNYLLGLIALSPLIQSCNFDLHKIESKAAMMNHYEDVSLTLAKENRALQAEVKRMEFEIDKLKEERAFYAAKAGMPVSETGNEEKVATGEHGGSGHGATHGENKQEVVHGEAAHGEAKHEEVAHENKGHEERHSSEPQTHVTSQNEHGARTIASIPPAESHSEKSTDFVEFKTYKWAAEDMMQIADKEFKEKHFEKAAQFYFSLHENYPHFKGITDEFYFKAGISSYESGSHHDWTINHFEALMKQYPTSQYYRSAKLWVALTNLKLGEKKKFFATVEEFRKKYRNTNEWKILSNYYEKIEEKTNE